MKVLTLISIVPVLLAMGCAHSPRYSSIAAVPARDVVVVPSPVSDRPVLRVYPEAPVVVTAPLPAGVTATEHAIAESIRSMFNNDPGWAGLTDRVEIRVSGTTAHLTGTVASDSIRDRIEQKIRSISSVTRVDNGLRVVTP